MADERRVEVGEGLLDIRELGVDNNGTEPDKNPRPWAEDIVRDVEKEDGAEGILFRFRRKHTLGDIAPPARFSAGIPDRPPLHCDRHDKNGNSDVPIIGKIGEDIQVVDPARALGNRQLLDKAGEPTDDRKVHGEVGRGNHRRHLDEELHHVDDKDPPESGVGRKDDVQSSHRRECLPAVEAKENAGDFAGGKVHGRHNHAIEEEAKVDRPEPADEARGLSRISDFIKLKIRHDP